MQILPLVTKAANGAKTSTTHTELSRQIDALLLR